MTQQFSGLKASATEDEAKSESCKFGSFTNLDAEFFQSLNDFKSDFLFNKTESILAKPPHIYRQTLDVDNLISV